MKTLFIAARHPRVWLVLATLVVAVTNPQPAVRAQTDPLARTGQTVTRIPDGRELLLGGITADGRAESSGWLRDAATARAITGLRHARAWHTATLLPDGTVLVLGGIDERGQPVEHAERVNLMTGASEPLPDLRWTARAAHTATLIDARRMVIAGGLRNGVMSPVVEQMDLQTWAITPVGALDAPRAFHAARLLATGETEVWGGNIPPDWAASPGVVIDSSSGNVRPIVTPESDDAFPWLAESDPQQWASNVALQPTVMLRLTRLARIETVNTTTVTLTGPSGVLAADVVRAEAGRLVFITPREALEPNATYQVTAEGLRDSAGTAFPVVQVTFTTAPDPQTSTDSDDEVWEPFEGNAVPTWRSNRPPSRWQELPPLMAPPGVTAVSGQVLKLNGTPLAGVTLRIQGQSVATDRTGRFLLVHERVTTGWREMWMDGRTANGRADSYGTFEAAVHVTAGRTTVLPYTIWMPKIDRANAVRIPSPTTGEIVITTPKIPGLELRLPPGTVISDEDGRIVREVSITPIPIDRPPFPLPDGVEVPIYFTIQPGGAYVAVTGSTGERRGARLIYPNYHGYRAGTTLDFWHYNPREGKRWYVYGQGTVSGDRRQVAPNPGVSLYEFTGAMIAPPSLNGPNGPSPGDPGKDGDPVHLGTGQFTLEATDLVLPDILPIGIHRTYRANDTIARSFGIGASHQNDMFLSGNTSPYNYLDLILPDGGRVHYDRISAGTGYSDAVYEHTASPTQYYKSKIAWNGTGWNLDLTDGTRITFLEGFGASRSSQAAVSRIQDRYGNAVVLTRNSGADLARISSPNGKWIELTYDASHRVTQAKDHANRVVQYTYDASGRLWKVTDPLSGVTEYTYDTSHRMLTIKDARGIVYLTNEYNAAGRVTKQTQADSTTYLFAYTLDGAGKVTQTDVTNPRGIVRRVTYSSTGYLLTDTAAQGLTQQRTLTYERQAGTNLVTAMVDALSRRTEYAYDSFGNVTSVTALAGTANAVTESSTYESTFQQLASRTDALNHTTTFAYDALGNLTTVTDPLSQQTTLTYNANGQPLTITTPAGAMQMTYDGSDVSTVTDPLTRTTTRFVDALGRLVRATNPLGQAVTHEYDVLNRVTKTTDALNGNTTFTYDANSNLLTLTDALNQTTTYTYNNMDRLATRTDPLSRAESYTYDANGNLQQRTDRKTQVTSYTYDPLDRTTVVTYADSSTTTNTYDAGDRLTQAVDSLAGTISRTYDQLDRLTQETTPEGTVNYTYDAAGRRTSMTVAGQTQVAYSYDNGNRLTSITQGASSVAFTYDSAGRRGTLTLPNGVIVTYSYDAGSQVTGIEYALGQTSLGNLTYTYNAAGSRIAVGGTWARTGLPATLSSATYDAANQVATSAGTSFTYDANGNLTNDGANTYSWNTRNQLTGISGGASASFTYDAFFRRRGKTIAGTTTNFLYDGFNSVQELASGGTPTANLLTGLDIDETFTRTDSGGTSTLLVDALGTTLALANTSGAVQTSYTYDPFGATTISGTASVNAAQFTGRENDGTGLYSYRSRFYSPALQRFVSEDPIGFAGGLNIHAYAMNSPTQFRDALGLAPDLECWAKCIERRRLTLPLPLISSVPKSIVPPGRVVSADQRLTTPLSVLSHFIKDLAPELAQGLRQAGRVLSPIGTIGTIGEGFWDWFIIFDCLRECKDKCQ